MSRDSKVLPIVAWIAGLACLVWLLPPFHVRPITRGATAGRDRQADVDVGRIATAFWNERLLAAAVAPVDVRLLLDALTRDPAAAAQTHGRRPGIGGSSFYYVSGDARVASIDHTGVWLDAGAAGPIRVVLLTGPVFGSALRDATGLLKADDFNSFQFNELSAQLNRLCESLGEPPLRDAAKVGATAHFLAAGRVTESDHDRLVLKLAPISVTLK